MTPNQKLFMLAAADIGVRERRGRANSPEIMQYFKESGHKWVNSEETPWCSAAMNAWCRRLDLPSTGKLSARSWLGLGHCSCIGVREHLRQGDIVVLWRGTRGGWKGHVGLFVANRGNHIYLLGGNQNNRVCIKSYPAYRFLAGKRFA